MSPLDTIQDRKVVQATGCIRVIRTQIVAADRQLLFKQRHGLRMPPSALINRGEVVERGSIYIARLSMFCCNLFQDILMQLHKDILEQVAAEHGKAGNVYAAALNNLAAIYQSTGRHSETMPLFEEELSICSDDLGADHPDTASSLNNLAVLYRVQRRHKVAAPLLKEAVEIMERLLGAEHPNTKIMRENYEGLLAKLEEERAE